MEKTKKFDDTVSSYYTEIAKIPQLSADEEIELAKIMANNAKSSREYKVARTKFANANLKLVVNVAKKYLCTGLEMLDLIQEGNIGLMKAVEKFDHTEGFRFSTYAWQAISRNIASYAKKLKPELFIKKKDNKNTEVSKEEIDEQKPEVPQNKIGSTEKKIMYLISLSNNIGSDPDSNTVEDYVEDPNAVNPEDHVATEEDAKTFMNTLTKRECEIFDIMQYSLYYKEHSKFNKVYCEITNQDIADYYSISATRVRHIKEKIRREFYKVKFMS